LSQKYGNWVPCGYIARSKSGGNAVIMISTPEGKKTYYIADISDAIDALTGKAPYAKIFKPKT
jgi:hypothetical protein